MRWLFFLLLFSAFLCLPAALKRWTCSFHKERCIPPILEEQPGEMFSRLSPGEIQKALSQTFTYLDRGAQSFVFASEDRELVLKLFFFDGALEKAESLVQSCKAAALAAEETGLVYLHFGPSDKSLPSLKLCGPAWHWTELKGANYCFALQRRAIPLKESLGSAYFAGNREVFLQRIDAFFALLQKRISMGIRNSDRSLFSNFGFIEGGGAIEIDFGHYFFDPEWTEEAGKREVDRYRKRLVEWASRNMADWKEEIERR